MQKTNSKNDSSDSSDKKVKRLYHQRYRTEWEKFPAFANWLRSSNDGYSAHCRICDINVLARLASIKQHLITRKHQEGARCNDFLSQVNGNWREKTPRMNPF